MSAVLSPTPVTVDDWLRWQETLHPREIDLDLARVVEVGGRMGLQPFPAPILAVGGTNGKGSCALVLERLLAGRTGVYTSPHLVRYNERIRIDGEPVDDAVLVAAFRAVADARGDIPLTYFEFGTLTAMRCFARAGVDQAVLEVGMGGRLDAVNAFDAEAAVITSIGLDHVDWLGDSREAIGREKAGIFRADRPAICADRDPPASIAAAASKTGAMLRRIGADFELVAESGCWRWHDWTGAEFTLQAVPGLLPDNLAAALATLRAVGYPLDVSAIDARLAGFAVPGRRQRLGGAVDLVLDVGHNVEAMAVLRDWLAQHPVSGRTLAVIGMLANKPIAGAAGCLAEKVSEWFAGGLDGPRGLDGEALAMQLPGPAAAFEDIGSAFAAARARAEPGDRILICGSFYTVGEVMTLLEDSPWKT